MDVALEGTAMTCIGRFIGSLVLVLILASCAHSGQLIDHTSAQRLQSQTFAIDVVCKSLFGGFSTGGTGVAVSRSHILTAAHVANACGPLEAVFTAKAKDGTSYRLGLVEASQDVDAAVFRVLSLGSPFKPVPIRYSRIQKGETLCAVSAHPAYAWRVDCGQVIKPLYNSRFCGPRGIVTMGQTIGGNQGRTVAMHPGQTLELIAEVRDVNLRLSLLAKANTWLEQENERLRGHCETCIDQDCRRAVADELTREAQRNGEYV